MDHEDDYTCRICLESSSRDEVIAPCSCRGSSKWVHRTCLDQWRTTREDKAFSKCTECLQEYTLISRIDDSYRPKLMRRATFFFFVLRDLSVAFLLLQMLIIGLSGIVYISDEKSHWLVAFFHSEAHLRLFYYFCGASIFLSSLGMLYFAGFTPRNLNRDCSLICSNCDNRGTNRGGFTGMPWNWLMCLDYGGGLGGGGCPCCEAGCADATCCTSCSELFGNLPSELAIFFLLFIFILACVGAMVAVFVGTMYIGRVISSHVHLLQKESLARDYIVADLDDLGTSSNGPGSGSGSGNMLSDVEIGMTSLSPIHCIEAPLGSLSSASSSLQQDDNSGYISIHTDEIAITYPPERQRDREREHQSNTASADSAILYSSLRRRSEGNRTLSEAQRRELTALGLM